MIDYDIFVHAQDEMESLLQHLCDEHDLDIIGPLHDVARALLQSLLDIDIDEMLELEASEGISKEWAEKVQLAQKKITYLIGGVLYNRIPYGSEDVDLGADFGPCGDCAVVKGQLHVPFCDIERCPRCGWQAFTCDCECEDDDLEMFQS